MWTAMPKVKQENFFLAVKTSRSCLWHQGATCFIRLLRACLKSLTQKLDGQIVKKTYKVFVYVPVPILISSSLGVLWNNIQSVYQRMTGSSCFQAQHPLLFTWAQDPLAMINTKACCSTPKGTGMHGCSLQCHRSAAHGTFTTWACGSLVLRAFDCLWWPSWLLFTWLILAADCSFNRWRRLTCCGLLQNSRSRFVSIQQMVIWALKS